MALPRSILLRSAFIFLTEFGFDRFIFLLAVRLRILTRRSACLRGSLFIHLLRQLMGKGTDFIEVALHGIVILFPETLLSCRDRRFNFSFCRSVELITIF